MREQLLGYLLGALDDDEHEEIKRRLAVDTALAEEMMALRTSLGLLPNPDDDDPLPRQCGGCTRPKMRYDDEAPTPPPGLAMRTLDFVFQHPASWQTGTAIAAQPVALGGAAREAARLSPTAEVARGSHRLRLADMAVAAGVIVAASMLFFPAIANSRFQSRLAMCRNNLQQMGAALLDFSGRHNNTFPVVAATGKRGVAGVYAPTLRTAGYFPEKAPVICPASQLAEEPLAIEPPTLEQLDNAEGEQLAKYQRTMGGSYAYTLGHTENGQLKPTRNQARPRFALMADAPCSSKAPCGNTFGANHDQCGQNVLFEDGHVSYLNTCHEASCKDDFYHNDQGARQAGVHPDDAVVGSSSTAPIVYVSGNK